ncbi:MAG: hypothetical protein Q4E36_03490 [Bacillota bacterium]|nr:hypothetical protein [Bacillota bacterium]
MAIDVEKTLSYYETNDFSHDCKCSFCEFFRTYFKEDFSSLHTYLLSLGIDSRKFFELALPYLDEEKDLVYPFVQYIVFTKGAKDFKEVFAGLDLYASENHPPTDIKEDHLVLEFGPIKFSKAQVGADLYRDLEED